jgi:hypothetical protein
VFGGVGWLYGGIAGAVVFKLMHDVISGITPQYWTFWIGLFLVVLVMVGPTTTRGRGTGGKTYLPSSNARLNRKCGCDGIRVVRSHSGGFALGVSAFPADGSRRPRGPDGNLSDGGLPIGAVSDHASSGNASAID